MTKLGLNIPNFGPTGTPDEMREWIRFARDHGFSLAMMSDHVAVTPDVAELYPAPFLDPFASLAWLAGGDLGGLELGTTVTILPYRHPLLTASLASALHTLTGGRFVLGVAAGWARQEFDAIGVPFADRGRMSEEYLAAITGAFRDDTASLDGEFVRYRDVVSTHLGGPPIWVGGTAPAVIRRAAAYGDAWHPNNASLAWLRDTGLPRLREHSADTAFAPRMRARPGDTTLHDDRPPGTGTLAQVVGDFRALIEMGATYVVLDTNPDHPRDRRAPAEDRKWLARVAAELLR